MKFLMIQKDKMVRAQDIIYLGVAPKMVKGKVKDELVQDGFQVRCNIEGGGVVLSERFENQEEAFRLLLEISDGKHFVSVPI